MEKVFEIVKIKQVTRELEGEELQTIRSSSNAAKVACSYIGDDDREVFFVMCLNTKNHVVAVHRAHVGSLNASIVHPREVFKAAILNNAASIICAHQHPSSDLEPSREDIAVTERLQLAGKMLGIELLDHVIVNYKGEYLSLREKGYID